MSNEETNTSSSSSVSQLGAEDLCVCVRLSLKTVCHRTRPCQAAYVEPTVCVRDVVIVTVSETYSCKCRSLRNLQIMYWRNVNIKRAPN